MKTVNRWRVFCTINWFLTGVREVADSTNPVTDEVYAFWLNLENKSSNMWWKDSEIGV